MKRGSKVRKCCVCGDKIFWYVPTGEVILGMPTSKIKTIKPYSYSKTRKGYTCKECCEKLG